MLTGCFSSSVLTLRPNLSQSCRTTSSLAQEALSKSWLIWKFSPGRSYPSSQSPVRGWARIPFLWRWLELLPTMHSLVRVTVTHDVSNASGCLVWNSLTAAPVFITLFIYFYFFNDLQFAFADTSFSSFPADDVIIVANLQTSFFLFGNSWWFFDFVIPVSILLT